MQTTVASDATHYRLSGSRADLALADERCTIRTNTKPRIARGLCDAIDLLAGSRTECCKADSGIAPCVCQQARRSGEFMSKAKANYETMKRAACYFFAANYILGGGRGKLTDGNLLFLSKDELASRARAVVGDVAGEHRDLTILRFGEWVLDVNSWCPDEERQLFLRILRGKLSRAGVKEFVDVSSGIVAKPAKPAKPVQAKQRTKAPGIPSIGEAHPDYTDSAAFYASQAWKQLRYLFLRNGGGKCNCCGATAASGAVLHVDHIIPRWKEPSRELDITNLQCLCADCNMGKGAWDQTDWRPNGAMDCDALAHMQSIAKEPT